MKWHSAEPEPAIVVRPPAAASLDEAAAAIELWEFYSGRTLDGAQVCAVELMLAEDADGRWAARTTGRAESRQNGKGDEIEVVEFWGLSQRAEAILHTAHELPTSKRAQQRMLDLLDSHRDLRRLVRRVGRSNSDRSIEFESGGVVVYRTRTLGGGRGLDDISRLVVDEAQHVRGEQLASSTPIMAVNPNPQTNFAGSGGIGVKSADWWDLRLRALMAVREGSDPGRFGWLEHSAEEVTLDDDDWPLSLTPAPDDRDAWRRANPAYPHRIEDAYLAEQLRILGPERFSREHLCVWDPLPRPDATYETEISRVDWANARDGKGSIRRRIVVAVDVALDAKAGAIAVAGLRPDGMEQVELVEASDRTGWVMGALEGVFRRTKPPVCVVDASGPIRKMLPEVRILCREHRVRLVEVATRDFASACGAFADAIADRRCWHLGQTWLFDAVPFSVRRDYGDLWLWDRRVSELTCRLAAVTLARWGVVTATPNDSAYADDDDEDEDDSIDDGEVLTVV